MRKAQVLGIVVAAICIVLLALLWWPSEDQPSPDPTVPSAPDPTLAPSPFPDELPAPFGPDADAPGDDEFAQDPDSDMDVGSEARMEELSEEPAFEGAVIANIDIIFVDDLTEQLVQSYHPPKSEHNTGDRGLLRLHFSGLNRRYGLELVGLEHQSPTLLDAREEIFTNILRPEALETIWKLFLPAFEQSLAEALRNAIYTFPGPDNTIMQRPLTASEQSEFLQLLSVAAAELAQTIQAFVDHEQAIFKTDQWLQAQTNAFAAHARYQHAEAAVDAALQEVPDDQVRILAERQERDAAAQGIMRAIAAREQARQALLAIFASGRSNTVLEDADRLYLSEWLRRRLHAHPERVEAFDVLAAKLLELSLRLRPKS